MPGLPAGPRRPPGLASPLKGYQAGADPVVRAGTNGLFYYAGLVFDRGDTGRSAIFVARFIDNNNNENGDPIAYLGTRIVAADPGTRFLDKPWMAVDMPRGGATCTLPAPNNRTQRIPAGPAYVSCTAITGTGANVRSQIFLSRSTDCGVTWSAPIVDQPLAGPDQPGRVDRDRSAHGRGLRGVAAASPRPAQPTPTRSWPRARSTSAASSISLRSRTGSPSGTRP